MQDLASRLAAHPFLQQDELLTVLKGSPWTAAFAEARQRELLEVRACLGLPYAFTCHRHF